ncbi:MAG: nucleotidyltransferase domain-containing protein [Proteobacteria bacterium]|nr:nucleotidyltransferase domain-containing protein [Pseudomonadota bacterium]
MADKILIGARISPEMKRRLKRVAVERGVTVQSLVEGAVDGYLGMLDRQTPSLAPAVARLRAAADRFRQRGIEHLWVFGSVARGEARIGSDIDLAAEPARGRVLSVVGLASLKALASEVLGSPADVVLRAGLQPEIRAELDRDGISVF